MTIKKDVFIKQCDICNIDFISTKISNTKLCGSIKCKIKLDLLKHKNWRSKNRDKLLSLRRLRRTGTEGVKKFSLDESGNKKCSICKENKPKESYYLDKYTKKPYGKCFLCRQNIWSERSEDLKNKEKNRLRKLINNKRLTPKGRIDSRISNAIWYSLKKNKGFKSWTNLVGYTPEELKNHLEIMFTEGMNWEKFLRGDIHIDHRIPKSWFKYENYTDKEFVKCWSLDNLKPMWAIDNIRKNNRYAD
jgi:hypothetical protein